MLIITCGQCGTSQIVGFSRLVSLDNTPDGPVVKATCNNGHLTRTRYPGPQKRACQS